MEHDYPGDDEIVRLDRMEEFVFGSTQTGSLQQRLQKLLSVATEFPAVKPKSAPANTVDRQRTTNDTRQTSQDHPAFDYASYPRVAELEKHLLGSTYANDSLPDRLARLETKAFGRTSSSPDLCQRVDLLDQYADQHDLFHERQSMVPSAQRTPLAVASRVNAQAQNPFATNSPNGSPDDIDGRLGAMENLVFGHAYTSRPQSERLTHLEKKLVPYEHNLAQKDDQTRVNNLWNILKLANTMNGPRTTPGYQDVLAANSTKAAGGSNNSNSDNASVEKPSGTAHSWLHDLGKAVGADSSQSGGNANGNLNQGFNYPAGMYGFDLPGQNYNGASFWLP